MPLRSALGILDEKFPQLGVGWWMFMCEEAVGACQVVVPCAGHVMQGQPSSSGVCHNLLLGISLFLAMHGVCWDPLGCVCVPLFRFAGGVVFAKALTARAAISRKQQDLLLHPMKGGVS